MNFNPLRLPTRLLRSTVFCLVFLLLPLAQAKAAQVVYLASSNQPSPTRDQVETAARFYGLGFLPLFLASPQDAAAVWQAIANPSTVAIVLDADALPFIPRHSLLSATQRGTQSLPVMIAGINASTSESRLAEWTSGAVQGSRPSPVSGPVFEQIGNVPQVTRQLQGSTLPLGSHPPNYIVVAPAHRSETLAAVPSGDHLLPIFVRVPGTGPELFLASETRPAPVELSPDPFRQQAIFASMAAPMIFLGYAAGDRAWHSSGNYANFTIDDLWLREPYGHVGYGDLLAHSQQHNFHTTIAFIPWNYDRSQSAVAALFRAHPDRLSICVHGNDHIHQEFGPLDSHPLATQEKNIDQSLARMKKFSELTGVPFDPVMVFPHSVSPEKTFAELKRANYLATANSLNVPSDAATPPGAEFALRTATLNFANFPSLRRYSAETDIPNAQLAIDAFLGNPMLFYAHESFFASGMNAFDAVADYANQLQPGLQWESLGAIAQQLYLQKTEDDGTFAIRAYSPSLRIRNTEAHDAIFHVQKQEDFLFPVTVFVDGQNVPYQRDSSGFSLQLLIKAGSTTLIEARYGSLAPFPEVDLRSHSAEVTAIRLLSDFRDDFVSRYVVGRWFIRSYVTFGDRWRTAFLCFAGSLGLLALAWRRRRANSNHKQAQILVQSA